MSKESNIVYIGRKPIMNYVLAVITNFNSNTKEVSIKARGQAISTAVDVAEISRRRFLRDVKVDRINIGSEAIHIKEENRDKTVSTIDIRLTRGAFTEKAVAAEEKEPPSEKLVDDLNHIEGIGTKTAEKLRTQGVNSIQDLAESDPTQLLKDLHISEKRIKRWVSEAGKTLKDQ
jgi:DNA-binding protein